MAEVTDRKKQVKLNVKMHVIVITPVISYSAETWALGKEEA